MALVDVVVVARIDPIELELRIEDVNVAVRQNDDDVRTEPVVSTSFALRLFAAEKTSRCRERERRTTTSPRTRA